MTANKVPHAAFVDAKVVLKYTPRAYSRDQAENMAEDEAIAYLTDMKDAGEIEDFEIEGVAAEPMDSWTELEGRRDEIDELIEKEDQDDGRDDC